MKTREQKRAELALRHVNAVPKDKRDNFDTQVAKLPSRVITAGLPGAMAFLEAKKSKSEGSPELIAAITEAVRAFVGPFNGDLIDKIAADDDMFLRRATDEVMQFTIWLKRMVEAKY